MDQPSPIARRQGLHRRRLILAAPAFAATLLAGTAARAQTQGQAQAQAQAQAQTKIVAGMVAHGPPQWPQYIADEFGWFKADKIDLQLVTVGGGGVAQVAAGSLNMAHSGYPDFARAALHDAPVKIILSDFVGSPYGVFAKTSIKKIADLKGKLISIGGPNDITLIYIKPFLASAGLKTSDVDFIYAKAAGDRFAALASGAVDAAILNPPTYFKAIESGLSALGDTKPYAEGIPFTVWGANTSLGGAAPRRAHRVRARLQTGRCLALRSGEQTTGDRHSGQARQAGSEGFGRGLRLPDHQAEIIRAVRRRVGRSLRQDGRRTRGDRDDQGAVPAQVGDLQRQLRAGGAVIWRQRAD